MELASVLSPSTLSLRRIPCILITYIGPINHAIRRRVRTVVLVSSLIRTQVTGATVKTDTLDRRVKVSTGTRLIYINYPE